MALAEVKSMAPDELSVRLSDPSAAVAIHKDAVKAVVEKVEGKNTLMKHGDILEKAVPEIRERIKTVEKLDTSSLVASRPKLNINGEL